MQLGMKIHHDYKALYIMISNLNVEQKLQRDFFNTIPPKLPVFLGLLGEPAAVVFVPLFTIGCWDLSATS